MQHPPTKKYAIACKNILKLKTFVFREMKTGGSHDFNGMKTLKQKLII